MDIEYNSEILEVNTTEALDELIGKYSSEIRENEFNDLIKSEIEEENINYLDIQIKKIQAQIETYL